MKIKSLFIASILTLSLNANALETITVAATPVPHAEILEQVKPDLEKQGYKLEIKEFTDYVLPNLAVDNGEADANFFQHTPYLEEFNKNKGAKLIGTNSDITTPTEKGEMPACKALIAPIEAATNRQAYFVGKPNPLMMRAAMNRFHEIGIHSPDVAMIGDRMDTDMVAAIESGLDPVLVLSGVSSRETVQHFPYRPRLILNGVGDIPCC